MQTIGKRTRFTAPPAPIKAIAPDKKKNVAPALLAYFAGGFLADIFAPRKEAKQVTTQDVLDGRAADAGARCPRRKIVTHRYHVRRRK